ncbi:MAG: twitching motility protein, partial [Acidobacteriota bacterium]
AIEILVSNSRTREYIEKGEKEGRSITDAMNDGEMEGMQTFDAVLENLIRTNQITKEVGLSYASNANNLTLQISDMQLPREDEPGSGQVETTDVPSPQPVVPKRTGDTPQIEGFELNG